MPNRKIYMNSDRKNTLARKKPDFALNAKGVLYIVGRKLGLDPDTQTKKAEW